MLNFVNKTYSFRGKIDENYVWFEIKVVEIEVENKRLKITNATEEN